MENQTQAQLAADYKVVPASYKPRRSHLRGRSDPTHVTYSCKYICWIILGTVFAYHLAPTIFNLASVLPDMDTGSETYENWYFRTTVNTTWFPLSQFITFVCLTVFGWCYVAWVNLYRCNPFKDGNRSYQSFKLMLALTPVIFLMSGLFVFKQRHDLSGYCTEEENSRHIMLRASAIEEENSVALRAVLESEDNNLLLLHTLQRANYMQGFSASPTCHDYSDEEIFNWNFKLWFTGFLFVGLQFTHFDVGPFKNFSLSPSSMKTWGVFLWVSFIGMVIFGVALLYVDIQQMIESGCLWRYVIWILAILCFFFFGSKLKGPGYELHIHHYVVGLFALTLVSSQSEILALSHGFFMGMAIEGACRWGMDPIWTVKTTSVDDDKLVDPEQVGVHTPTERRRWTQIKSHQKKMRNSNEKAIAEAVKAQEHAYNPQPLRVSYVQTVPSTTYLQPAMINVPVPTYSQAPLAQNNFAYVSFAQPATIQVAQPMAQFAPQVVPQMPQMPQMPQAMPVQQPLFSYEYVHPEPAHQQMAAQVAPIRQQVQQRQSNLPPELMGLLTPEL